ncbi:RDD family protein [Solemya velesiana gill symbiont]|uniref:RDD family protein n=1 Tax=Solemya velesiana gill symbiont TaxID=1918948 RepID=A0A1T2KW11_9GAMM|nr:RDD family protein [Solemya velesiana gill symbiont]OOZ37033.1 RDD family protein [Solemya velesiana gill symbiont]
MEITAQAGTTDTVRTYETPEGIELQLRLAGPIVRACAWAIDLAIRMVAYGLILGVGSFFGGIGTALILIGFFLIEWFYPVFFEIRTGATPGKRAMGLVVINDNGTPISFSASVIRNLVRAADFLPLLYGVGLLVMLANRDFQRLGDMAAGTLVVYRDEEEKRGELPDVVSKPPPPGLTVDELRFFIEFAERSEKLTPERRWELANLLQSVTGEENQDAVNRLWSYAKWLTRGR